MNIQYKAWKLIAIGFGILSAALLALFLAQWIVTSPQAQATITSLGYGGVVLVAIIGGLNIFLPIPAFTLTPIFTAAGLSLPLIILALTIGTIIADYIGYLFGHISKPILYSRYPRVITHLENSITTKPKLLIPITFVFAAFIPLPNEVLIIPVAVLGVKFRRIFLPLLFGNLLNISIYATGMQTIFWWWF